MLQGFLNGFVIDNIFGESDIFSGAEIKNIIFYPMSATLSMEVLTKSRVVNPPPRWSKRGKWDFICLEIDIFTIREFCCTLNKMSLIVSDFTIEEKSGKYRFEIIEQSGNHISFETESGAQIQRITPMTAPC